MDKEKQKALEALYPELVMTSAKDFMEYGNGYLARAKLEIEYGDPTIAEQVYQALRHAAVEKVVFDGEMEFEEAERFYPSWSMAAAKTIVLPMPHSFNEDDDEVIRFPKDGGLDKILDNIDAKIASIEKEQKSGLANAAAPQKSSVSIQQDPYQRLGFAKKLVAYQDEAIGICWDLKEHLEEARPFMNGSSTYLTLIEQSIGMTAEIQKLLDGVRALGEREVKHAKYLIHVIENPFSE